MAFCHSLFLNLGERHPATWTRAVSPHARPPRNFILHNPVVFAILKKEKIGKAVLFMWLILAIGASVFAALTSILAKVGIEGVNSNLATAIRTFVVLLMSWGMVFITNAQGGIADISKRSWLFLILSGLATGASWLCYYKALQLGDVSKVVPIDKLSVIITMILAALLLHEKFTPKSIIGCVLIAAGTLLMVL